MELNKTFNSIIERDLQKFEEKNSNCTSVCYGTCMLVVNGSKDSTF